MGVRETERKCAIYMILLCCRLHTFALAHAHPSRCFCSIRSQLWNQEANACRLVYSSRQTHPYGRSCSVRSQVLIIIIHRLYDITQKYRADGCVFTNPPNDTPLLPGSTIIDGFWKVIVIPTTILWGITFERPPINVESGRKLVALGEFVNTQPSGRFCSVWSHIYSRIFVRIDVFHIVVGAHIIQLRKLWRQLRNRI